MYSVLSVTINHIVNGTLVVLLEHVDMNNILSYKKFLAHLYNLVFAVLVEQDDVVHVGAVGDELVFFQ